MEMKEPHNCSRSYIELKFHSDGQKSLVLRVPTYWDPVFHLWRGALHLPDSKKLIHASGTDSIELERNFLKEISTILGSSTELSQEIFSLFTVEE